MSLRSLWTLALLAPIATLSVACDDKDDDDDDDDDDDGEGGRGRGRWGGLGGGDAETSPGPDRDDEEGPGDTTEDPGTGWGSFERYDSSEGCSTSWSLQASPASCSSCDYAFEVEAELNFDDCMAFDSFSGQLSFERGAAYLDGEYLGAWSGDEGYLSWDSSAASESGDISAWYWGFIEW